MHEDMGSGGIAPPFLTSALDGGEWSGLRLSLFTPGKESLIPIGHGAVWTPDLVWTL
jgi:hypothetical protein